MTNAEKLNELVKKEFGTEGETFYYFLQDHSCYGFRCETAFCGNCKHRDFWKKEVTDNERQTKSKTL